MIKYVILHKEKQLPLKEDVITKQLTFDGGKIKLFDMYEECIKEITNGIPPFSAMELTIIAVEAND